MIFEYAVEPRAAGASWQGFLYLFEKFGSDRGRLVSRLPDKWEKKVIQAAKEAGVPDVKVASIIERLKSARPRIVDFGRSYDPGKSWTENALREHQRTPFHAIIALEGAAENPALLAVADLDESHALIAVARDRAVEREAKSIANALSGLLRVGTRIQFIDAFFDPYNARYKDTIRECLAIIRSNNPNAVCEIHYRYHDRKPSNVELEREASKLFRGIIPEGITVSVYCWKEKAGGADFHARYLLTDRGGIGVEAGFSAEGAHQTTDMHLMSFELSQTRLNAFARDAREFELVEPILEIASNGDVRRI